MIIDTIRMIIPPHELNAMIDVSFDPRFGHIMVVIANLDANNSFSISTKLPDAWDNITLAIKQTLIQAAVMKLGGKIIRNLQIKDGICMQIDDTPEKAYDRAMGVVG